MTPAGARWELDGSTLTLALDDARLPEPYVIDPAFRAVGAVSGGTATSISPAKPAGVVAGDQLVAFVAVNAPTANLVVLPPSGYTLVNTTTNGTNVSLHTYVKQATGAEPATYTFSFEAPAGTPASKAARAIVSAYSGIQSSNPIDSSFENTGGSSRTATVTGVGTNGTNRISIWSVTNNSTRTATNPTINGVATTERIDSITAAPALEVADAVEPAAFSGATVGTGNVLSGAAFWSTQVFSLIPDTTAPAQTFSVTPGTNPTGQYYDSATQTHYYNTASAGTFTVTSIPTDADSGIASVNFAAVALTGFTHTTITDTTSPYTSNTYSWTAGNTVSPGANRTTVTDNNANTAQGLTITRDVTAPASVYTAPASGGKYNAAGWPGSITGTASDGGSGLATVQVAIQQGAGNYYDGAAFNNAGITWLAATGTSSWSYAIAAAKLTTGNTYTISVRSTDNVGNVETAVTRSFLYDTVAPSFGTLAIGSPVNASVTGTTIYYRGNTTGSFTLSQPLTDADAGPTSVQYPAIATSRLDAQQRDRSAAPPPTSPPASAGPPAPPTPPATPSPAPTRPATPPPAPSPSRAT